MLASSQPNHTHLKRPHPPDPHLELAFHPLDILQLNSLPPASPGRLAPEEQEFLSHAHCIIVPKVVTADVATKPCKCETADDSLSGLASTMTPLVLVVEASEETLASHI